MQHDSVLTDTGFLSVVWGCPLNLFTPETGFRLPNESAGRYSAKNLHVVRIVASAQLVPFRGAVFVQASRAGQVRPVELGRLIPKHAQKQTAPNRSR